MPGYGPRRPSICMKLGGKIWIGKIGHMDSARCGKDADCFPSFWCALRNSSDCLGKPGKYHKKFGILRTIYNMITFYYYYYYYIVLLYIVLLLLVLLVVIVIIMCYYYVYTYYYVIVIIDCFDLLFYCYCLLLS